MIRDNPSFKNLENMLKNAKVLAKLRPVLRLFGRSGKRMAATLDAVPRLAEETEVLLSVPDRFSRALGPRGWIPHEYMNFEVMRRATETAESGAVDEAEAILRAYYSADTIRTQLRFFALRVKAYRARDELIQAATTDHEEGRFHASVPVVLAQMDGLVLDLAEASFFQRKNRRQLEAADSIAGHPQGLAALAALMGEARPSTSTSMIDLPYRHGILHGRDLGYANETVSAKAFAAFLSLLAWAERLETGTQFEAPPVEWPDPDTVTWLDVGRIWKETWVKLREHSEWKRQLRKTGFPSDKSGSGGGTWASPS